MRAALSRRWAGWTALAVMLGSMVAGAYGCASLPDVSPFATASTHLAAAVKASGAAISADLHASRDLQSKATQFDQAWAARNQAMRGVVSYSDGLVSIVKSTERARSSVQLLGDKVSALAQAAGVVQPGAGAAADIAIDTAAFIWAQIALVRGASSLQEALTCAQPAIDRLADVITQDNEDFARIVRAVAVEQRTLLGQNYNEAFGYQRSLAQRRTVLREKGYSDLRKTELDELTRIDQLMVPVSGQVQRFEEEKARIDRRERASLQLIAATREATDQWAGAHKDVVLAISQRRPVNTASLTDAALELRDLIKRVREL